MVDEAYVAHLEDLLLETTTQLLAIQEGLQFANMELDYYY